MPFGEQRPGFGGGHRPGFGGGHRPAFGGRGHPFFLFYIIGQILSIIFFRFPFWVISSIFPCFRPRRSWGFGRSVKVHGLKAFVDIMYTTGIGLPGDDSKTDQEKAAELGLVHFDGVPQLVQGELQRIATLNNVQSQPCTGYWTGDKHNGVGRRASPGEKVVYHLHGGGYVMDTANPLKSSSHPVVTGLLGHCKDHFQRAFAPEYRLSSAPPYKPKNPFPAALLDALAGYNYLVITLGFKPEDIIVSGDSAGGNLAHALVRYLVTNPLPNLGPPAGLLLFSPTVDWACTHTGPESSMTRHASSDFVGPILLSQYTTQALLGNIPPEEGASHVYINPGSRLLADQQGLFTGYPKTCFVTGGAEMTLDGMVSMHKAMLKDMGEDKVVYIEGQDCTHDFIALRHEPERTQALLRVKAWVAGLF